ncbi:glycosyltransferase involved in cell wall biosynthesis [Chitinophaga skermanii]|uniref:Glycosyltransferase involved in cell wall biosynthesis n=1 Tax=Chitinophaga skermanii TaxID=331697 RepID=A0A327QKJ9_9BACT|nr:glycosyltransferase [Chitinophaga skermanii]RAJ02287.1 glycosyltransferase involved in cell wall biosynthesis [Chitinophaga skermanii]
MNILFAGKFEADYNRTKIIIDGLQQTPGVQLSTYNFYTRSRWNIFALRKACAKADVVFLPSFSHRDVAWVKLWTRKPIIFDPLISRYLTKVFDYKKVKEHSFRAKKNFLKDKVSLQAATKVICDTQAHKQYFHDTFEVPLEKMHVVEVGVNTGEFFPQQHPQSNKFVVGFYGGFIPLQGARYILETAKVLKDYHDIEFQLIGEGFEYKKMRALAEEYGLTNVVFKGWVKYDQLNAAVNTFDIALGIFGDGLKAQLVIPNKIYHYAALQKAIITMDTPAMREVFTGDTNIVLTSQDPVTIAAQVLALKENPQRRETLAAAGFKLITENYNQQKIAGKVVAIAQQLLQP